MIGTTNVPLNTPDEITAGVSTICDEIHSSSCEPSRRDCVRLPSGSKILLSSLRLKHSTSFRILRTHLRTIASRDPRPEVTDAKTINTRLYQVEVTCGHACQAFR